MRTNYKEFKKIHEDANVATLKHPEGHEVRVAKGALSDHMKKQISSLKFCSGGEVPQGYAMGGQVAERDDKKEKKPEPKSLPLDPDKTKAFEKGFKSAFADGGEVHGGMSMPDGTEAQPNFQQEQQSPDITSQLAMMPLPQAPQGPQNPVIAQSAPQAPVPQQANVVEQGMNSQLAGISNQAKAEGKLGNQEAALAEQNTKRLQELDSQHAQTQQRLTNEIDNVINEVRTQKIDPKHFWNSRSDLGKASTAIGLILGGIGAGIGGGPNMALEFLNKQIDNDIEGQKMEMGRRMNALSGLQHQFGNLTDATNMAKAMQAGVYASQLMEAASKSKDPMAMARAQQASGQILAQYGPLVQQTALRQTVLNGMQSGHVQPAEAVKAIVPEKDQHLAYEEVKQAENQAQGLQSLKATMDKVAKLQTGTNRVFNPIQSRSQIEALNTQIAGHVKEIFGKTSDTELEILKHNEIKMTDDAKTVAVKTKNILDLASKEQSHPVLDANHIKIPKVLVNKFNPR